MSLKAIILGCDCASVLVGGVVFLLVLYLLLRKKHKNLPPGPHGLPIFGYTPFFGENAAEDLRKMKEKYGPIMSIQMGREYWVVLNDFSTIQETLVKHGDKFSGRPKTFVLDLITEGNGLIFADYGKTWKNLRKFGLMTLRGFGVGKKGMEEKVIEETPFLIEMLTKEDQESHAMKLTKCVSNIICGVIFGSRFEYDDVTFTTLVGMLKSIFSDNLDGKLLGLMASAPVLRHLPIFNGALKRMFKDLGEFMDLLRDSIKEHQDTLDKENIRDFIDVFLVEMEERGNGDKIFNEKQLLQYIRDLFEAGTATTSSTLNWGLLALVHHQDYQEKIAQEIDAVLGESGVPTMKHREQMPYMCAFVQELLRHRTLVPMSVMHKTNEAHTIRGYTIPQNTTVIPNIWSVHFDPDLFENPEEFRPERFIDENLKFVKSSHVIPFSVGPRHCLGEQLARMEIFIFLTGIVQRLKILPDPNNPPPPLSKGAFILALTYEPPNYKLKFERR